MFKNSHLLGATSQVSQSTEKGKSLNTGFNHLPTPCECQNLTHHAAQVWGSSLLDKKLLKKSHH